MISLQRTMAAFALALPVFGYAQTFPVKAVRIIVPFPAGGGLDFTTRVVAQKLGDAHHTTADAFGAFMKAEQAKYAKVIADAGIKVD